MGKLGFRDNGSPYVYEEITGTSSAAIGLDQGDSGKLKVVVSLSPNATPGGTPLQMTIDPAANGNITFTPNGSGNVVVGNGSLVVSAGNVTVPASNSSGNEGFFVLDSLVFLSALGTGNTFVGQNVANLTLNGAMAQYNTLVGTNTATGITTAATNCSLGAFALQDLTTGASNIAVGVGALQHIVNGQFNIGIGTSTGNLMTTGNESDNILIGNRGVNGESNAIRIGVDGSGSQQQNACYIAGIYGVTPGGGGLNMATIDANGQLGSQALPGAGGITQLDGNTGSATGATVNVIADTGEGTSLITGDNVATLTLTYTDVDFNTVIGTSGFVAAHTVGVAVANTGLGAGNLSAVTTASGNTAIGFNAAASMLSGINNTIVGTNAMGSSTTASTNTALGVSALTTLDGGSENIAVGAGAGSNYTTTESDNILIGNDGVLADANTIRIGTQGSGSGQQDTTFIAGIYGVTPGAGGLNMATIDSAGQLGSQAIPSFAGITITGDSGGALGPASAFTFTGGTTGLTFAGAGTTETLGGTLAIANGGTNATSMANTDGVVYYDGTRLVTTAVGTATHVLTSNGAGLAPTFQAAPASSISITGDSGGALTGSSFTFTGGTTGLTFAGAGSTETLGGTLAIANGGTNATSMANTDGVVYYDGTRLVTTAVGTATHVLTSNGAGVAPTFQAVPASGGMTWSEQTGTTQAMAVANGYILNNAGVVTATLPATAAVGDIMAIVGKGAGGWLMAQNSGQTVHFGSVNTTTGAGGSLASTNRYDSLEIICITANTDFVVRSSIGNLTVV